MPETGGAQVVSGTADPDSGRYINLDAEARFVPTAILRDAYVRYPDSTQPSAPPFVPLPERGLELGIVRSEVPEIARAVSSLLTCSLEDARCDRGGHLPPAVVARVQQEIISPYGVGHLWGAFGHRFVLARPVSPDTHELVATILVARRKGTIFFFTGRYNNIRHSQLEKLIDLGQPYRDDPAQRWLDLFAFPPPARFKPQGYHHIANYVVARSARREGLGQLLLDQIVASYARDTMVARQAPVSHSQHLLCGRGLWQIGDPPWLARMQRLGFYLRWGAESFFLEPDWAPLPPVHDANQQPISHLTYNASFGLPERYRGRLPEHRSPEHLLARLPEVIRLSERPDAKLQYFQTMFDFPTG